MPAEGWESVPRTNKGERHQALCFETAVVSQKARHCATDRSLPRLLRERQSDSAKIDTREFRQRIAQGALWQHRGQGAIGAGGNLMKGSAAACNDDTRP